jgi:hypothetical protein
MPKSTTPDAATYARWGKLQGRAADPSSGATERTVAAKAAAQMVEDHPWIPAYHKKVTAPDDAPPPPRRAPGAAPARDIAAAIFAAAVEQAATEAPTLAQNFVRNLASRADQALGAAVMGTSTTRKPKSAARATTSDLLDSVDVAGITLGGEEDDADGDLIAVSLLLTAEQAVALLDRLEEAGGKTIVKSVGDLVLAAIRETLEEGECGEWAFGDPVVPDES